MSTADVPLVAERVARLLAAYDPGRGPDASFWGLQFDLGLAWVEHPVAEGGLALDRGLQREVDAALARAGVPAAPWRSGVGLLLAAPTLNAFGTPDQRSRHLRAIFTGAEVWCQLFSEPGAGSDIAAIGTRAERRGDAWVINGQKVWTSLGRVARWGLLCARTDLDVPKHEGLTYFIADMHAEGVETRPLRQITGESEFDEVFLTDVVIPDERRVGDVGSGWAVTMATLAHERAAGAAMPPRDVGAVGHLMTAWRARSSGSPQLQDRVIDIAVRSEVLRMTASQATRDDGAAPSAAWSFLKLARTELEQDAADLCLTLLGPEGLTYDDYAAPSGAGLDGVIASPDPRRAYLASRALTLGGGTSEIQRTIIADRILGLPREHQADRGMAWRQIPRTDTTKEK